MPKNEQAGTLVERIGKAIKELTNPYLKCAPFVLDVLGECEDFIEQSTHPLDDGELGLHIDILQHFVDDTYQSRPEDEDIIFIRDELNEIKIQYVNLHNKLQIIR